MKHRQSMDRTSFAGLFPKWRPGGNSEKSRFPPTFFTSQPVEDYPCSISRPSHFGCVPKHPRKFAWLERFDEVVVESCFQNRPAIFWSAISSQRD